jgi:hypothetical protein
MMTENLTKALHSLTFACDELKRAHSDSVGKNDFAEIVILRLLGKAHELKQDIDRATQAATREFKHSPQASSPAASETAPGSLGSAAPVAGQAGAASINNTFPKGRHA